MTRRIHIETWGCQMNVADSERILALMARKNYQPATSEFDAQLIVLNTCHIREKAKHKVISRLGQLRKLKSQRPALKIAVVGCVAQAEGKRLFNEAEGIDYLLGPAKLEQLPELVTGSEQGTALGFNNDQVLATADCEVTPSLSGKVSRYLNIMQGCNNYCTFCVVPFTRGPERSQQPALILEQARKLVAEGVKEITLLGQNVNSYGQDLSDQQLGNPFVSLLTDVCQLDGLERLRFTTSNPHDFSTDLIELFANEKKLGRHVHLPIQSGSDNILQAMKRKVNRRQIIEIVDALRLHGDDFAISSDIIVGFPGETDEDFAETLSIVEQIGFSFIFSFKYSPRPNTAARRFRQQVDDKIKSQRLAKLQSLQKKITEQLNTREIGQQRTVLIHYRSRKEPNIYYGRTAHFRLVRVPCGRDIVGQLIPVEITEANATALVGNIANV